MIPARPLVVSVSADAAHRFSKPVLSHIRLVAGHGVEGDAHAGPFVKHRFLARRDSRTPNDRQVHLMESELFAELADEGFTVGPGMLGENVTTRGLDLSRLPLGTRLYLGAEAVVELRGLRTPCVLINRFRAGLLVAVLRTGPRPHYRAGVMARVVAGGLVRAGDAIAVDAPDTPHRRLPAI
jgi:MOSC domain-containing protein YiiM